MCVGKNAHEADRSSGCQQLRLVRLAGLTRCEALCRCLEIGLASVQTEGFGRGRNTLAGRALIGCGSARGIGGAWCGVQRSTERSDPRKARPPAAGRDCYPTRLIAAAAGGRAQRKMTDKGNLENIQVLIVTLRPHNTLRHEKSISPNTNNFQCDNDMQLQFIATKQFTYKRNRG